jgi:hypothetical protein
VSAGCFGFDNLLSRCRLLFRVACWCACGSEHSYSYDILTFVSSSSCISCCTVLVAAHALVALEVPALCFTVAWPACRDEHRQAVDGSSGDGRTRSPRRGRTARSFCWLPTLSARPATATRVPADHAMALHQVDARQPTNQVGLRAMPNDRCIFAQPTTPTQPILIFLQLSSLAPMLGTLMP